MTHQDICKQLGIPETTEQPWVNPLVTAKEYEFRQRLTEDVGGGYRVRAIKRCVKHLVNFNSEYNCWFDMARMFIRVRCPKCGRTMKSGNGGSAGDSHGILFTCQKCKTAFSLSGQSDSFKVTFPEKQ